MAPRNVTRSHPKDAIAMLHADHHKVRQLFRAYWTAKDPATQWEIALHIFDELEVHVQLEEVVFYQAVEEETTSLGRRLVQTSLEEHQEALALIQDLRGLAPSSPAFENAFQALVLTGRTPHDRRRNGDVPAGGAEVKEDRKDLRDEMLHLKAHLLAS
jgi:hypothetical protein